MADDVSLTNELEDTEERPSYDWSRVDVTRLAEPQAIRHLVTLGIAVLVLVWPSRTEEVIGRLIGLALVVMSLMTMWANTRSRSLGWRTLLVPLAGVGAGMFFLIAPVRTEAAVGRVLGALLLAKGVGELVRLRRAGRDEIGWLIASASACVAVGGFIVLFPVALFATTIATLAVALIVIEVIALTVILDPTRDDDTSLSTTSALIGRWFAARPKAVDDRQQLYERLLYEGEQTQTKIVRFVMLMVFAAVIASMGVVADSTAVVVGAMLIAPLMTPLMAMALSLVMGWPNRLGRSSLVALGGIVLAISIGLVIGLADFTIVDTLSNSQIIGRSNPTVVDLVTAIAAGAAGAYGLSRPDVSDSLPGVAIAIALVPPLTVIGISYSQRDWESGNGALLLFLTNALAIVVVGGLMFLLLGVAPLSRATENQHRVRTALALIVGATALIVGALVLNGTTVATNVFEQRAAQRVVDEWIAPFSDHSTVSITLNGDSVSVVLAGPAETASPTADDLAAELSGELGRPIAVNMRIRLETQETSG